MSEAARKVLLIAMPTQGQVATQTVRALVGLTQGLARRGVPFAFETYEFSDIVFSRNQLMCRFLTEERFTHMLFMDSDMVVQPQAVWRLLDFGVDFAATAYPQKHPRWGRLRALVEAEMRKPPAERASTAELVGRAWIYNHQRADFGGGPWVPKRRGGFITVPAAGTGLMLLSRAVPETMVARGIAPRRQRMEEVPLHRGLRYHDFFSHRTSPDGGLIYGEDQSFCMRWVHDCGGEIWLDTESTVTHLGVAPHSGRYADQLAEEFPRIDDVGEGGEVPSGA